MGFQRGHSKRGGRKKGTPNKLNGTLKEMILQALSNAGGVEYLERCAQKQPQAFLSLVGRVLPLQVHESNHQPMVPKRVVDEFHLDKK